MARKQINQQYFPGCTGKACYVTRGEALTVIRKWKGAKNCSCYKCKFCPYWHITSMGAKIQKQVKRKLKKYVSYLMRSR